MTPAPLPVSTPKKKKINRRVKLQDRTVRALKPAESPYYMSDELVAGLQVRVSPLDGSKSYSLRYRDKTGRQKRYTLGRGDVLSLADARKRAKDALKQVAAGHDPHDEKVENREADTVGSFAQVYVEEYTKKKKKSWRSDDSYLRNAILPRWKDRLMKDITRRDAQGLIDGIAKSGAIYANRIRALLHGMFEFALKRDVVEVNVITATTKPGEERQRDRVLTPEEIRRFWTATETLPLEMRSAWRLRLVTAQRKSEIQNATWNEIDMESGWWTIPAARSKNALAHRVPLSAMALNILRALKEQQDARVAKQKNPKPPTFIVAGARGKRQQREAAAMFTLPTSTGMICGGRRRR